MDFRTAGVAAVVLSLALSTACDSRSAPAARPAPSPSIAPNAATRDARFLVEELEERHPDLFHALSRARWRRAADRFVASADDLSDEEFLVEAMRITALPTLEGRDGHTGLFPTHAGIELHSYPLRLYDFADGMFVVDALPPHESLVGAEVVGVGRHPMSRIRRELYPLISRDNASSLRARFPTMVTTDEVLAGSGLAPSGAARFRFTAEGKTFTRTLEPVPMSEYEEWAGGHYVMSTLPPDPRVPYLSHLQAVQWARYVPDENLLYLQYNFVDYPGDLIDALERHARRKGLRVVVDVRHNPGGDNTTYGPLVDALKGSTVDDGDSLFLIAGRATFSAAGNFVAEILHRTKATSVGEPSGGSPNQFGDSQVIRLPHSGITAHAAAYFISVVPGDARRAISPDVPVGTTSNDYFSHRDPAMDAILELRR